MSVKSVDLVPFEILSHLYVKPDRLRPCEPRHEKTNVLVFDLVRHKLGCIATEDG